MVSSRSGPSAVETLGASASRGIHLASDGRQQLDIGRSPPTGLAQSTVPSVLYTRSDIEGNDIDCGQASSRCRLGNCLSVPTSCLVLPLPHASFPRRRTIPANPVSLHQATIHRTLFLLRGALPRPVLTKIPLLPAQRRTAGFPMDSTMRRQPAGSTKSAR